jgi:ADP-heptose:LPS heptosyltransferase
MELKTKQQLDYVLGSVATFVLRPLVKMFGLLLKRDHSPVVKERAAVIKLLGGGSLVIALSALLGLRQKYPNTRLSLVTTKAIKPFADVLSVFDEIIIIDDKSLLGLATSGIRLLWSLFLVDTIIDFEVYSRFTTVLSTLTCARNRIDFYLDSTFWREGLATHLIFFNRFAGSYHFYESAAVAVGANPASMTECGFHVARINGFEVYDTPIDGRITTQNAPGRICIAPACSDLGKERMLNGSQWERVLPRIIGDATEVVVLGGPADSDTANAFILHGQRVINGVTWINACDGRTLRDSLELLASCSRLIAIDSSLLHFGRLFGVPTVSFWGPTHPMTRLNDTVGPNDQVWYEKLPCSPCVHTTDIPPCAGNNLCIEAAVRRSCGETVDSVDFYPPPFVHLERK